MLPGTREYKSAPFWKSQVICRSWCFLFIHNPSEVSWNFRKVHSEAKVIKSHLPYHESDYSGCRLTLTYQYILLYSNVYSIFLKRSDYKLHTPNFGRCSSCETSCICADWFPRHEFTPTPCWYSRLHCMLKLWCHQRFDVHTKLHKNWAVCPIDACNWWTDRHSYLASRVHKNDGNSKRRCMLKVGNNRIGSTFDLQSTVVTSFTLFIPYIVTQ